MKARLRHLQIALLPLTLRVWIAGKTNNYFGRRFDVHERPYTHVYKKFGHLACVREAKTTNSWNIPA